MATCEDFPCCGHEQGCCPDYDDTGKQLNMKCLCGATLDVNRQSSLCAACLSEAADDMEIDEQYMREDEDEE